MPWYTMEESYKEEVKGRRLVAVFAESLEDAQNGLIEDSDVIKEEPNLAFPDGEEE